MALRIKAPAAQVWQLINAALEKVNQVHGNGLNLGIRFDKLAEDVNKIEGGKYNVIPATIQKGMFYGVRKIINERKSPNELVTFEENYLDGLSQYAYQQSFASKFGEFSETIIESIPLPALNHEWNGTARELGIINVTNELTSSQFEPHSIMESAQKSLSFMGILGSKWVAEKEIFENFLSTVQSHSGKVRYLLINPNSKAFRDLHTMRGGSLSDTSTPIFKELLHEFSCLEVKFYDFVPSFRLLFIDDEILGLSTYKLDQRGYFKSEMGWKAPHLVISAKGTWTLYFPFKSYFEHVWNTAKPFNDVIE